MKLKHPLGIIPIVAVLYILSGLPAEAKDKPIWEWSQYEKFNCCPSLEEWLGGTSVGSGIENDQDAQIVQKCEHVKICKPSATINNYAEQEPTVKDVKPQVKVDYEGDIEYDEDSDQTEYYDGDYSNGEYNPGHLSEADIKNYKKNGLHIVIALPYKSNYDYQGELKVTVGVKGQYSTSETYDVSDKIKSDGDGRSVIIYYWFKPGLVPVGTEYFVCAENLDSKDKNCNTGVNGPDKEPEYITVPMPQ